MQTMKRIVKDIVLYVFAAWMGISVSGCNSWLDLKPDNSQISDQYWQSKEEVEAVLASAYKQLRSCLDEFVFWGELRGDALDYTKSTTDDYSKIKDLDILPENSLTRWSDLYAAIGYANSVIKYSPMVLETDATFTQTASDAYIAEAVFIRSLCYFYLVRTFNRVPWVSEPYVDDSQEYSVPVSTEAEVLNQVTTDLETWLQKCKKGYESDDPDTWMNIGRATQWAYHALLADIYLWQEEYSRCIEHCDKLINSQKFTLLDGKRWFELFYPGYSEEGIFELAYDYDEDETTNNLYAWFYNSSTTACSFLLTDQTVELFTEYAAVKDLRGVNVTYTEDKRIWKQGGTGKKDEGGVERSSTELKDNNWIFYRFAEIFLMKAEALIMSGDLKGGYDLIVDKIRTRAGYTQHPDFNEDEYSVLSFLMEEREREFIGEGKRWFDILRMAKRAQYKYKDYLLEVLLANVPAKFYNTYRSKLSDPNSWYLPINESEITNSLGVLEQNPYYANVK